MILTRVIPVTLTIACNPAFAAISSSQSASTIPQAGQIIYSDSKNVQPFSTWIKSKEAQALILYKGYQEPMVVDQKTNEVKSEGLQVFVAKVRTVLNADPTAIPAKLPQILDINKLSKLDLSIKHKQISNAQLLATQISSGQPVTAFQWCNEQFGNVITRPARDFSLKQENAHPWCQPSERSICVESCYVYPSKVQTAYSFINAVDVSDQKDLASASQSELRYYANDSEYGTPLAELTGVNSPVVGVIEQNLFYFNQTVHFMKLLFVMQKHPSDPTKTVLTNFISLGFRNHTWKTWGFILEPILTMGIPGYTEGLLSGLPNYSKIMTKELATIMEK